MKVTEYTLNINADKPFSVIHMTDNHICLADSRETVRKQELCKSRINGFTEGHPETQEKINGEMFDYVRASGLTLIHTGDMIDFVSRSALEYAEDKFRGIDVVFCAGNHEFSQYVGEAWEDENYKMQSIDLVCKHLGNGIEFGIRDINGIRFITLDNSYYYVFDRQLEKLKEAVADGMPWILVVHNPVYSEDMYRRVTAGKPEDEPPYLTGCPEEKLKNLSEHRFRQQKTDSITAEFVKFCNESKTLKAVFAGHIHEGVIGYLDNGVPQLAGDGAFRGVVYKVNII